MRAHVFFSLCAWSILQFSGKVNVCRSILKEGTDDEMLFTSSLGENHVKLSTSKVADSLPGVLGPVIFKTAYNFTTELTQPCKMGAFHQVATSW